MTRLPRWRRGALALVALEPIAVFEIVAPPARAYFSDRPIVTLSKAPIAPTVDRGEV